MTHKFYVIFETDKPMFTDKNEVNSARAVAEMLRCVAVDVEENGLVANEAMPVYSFYTEKESLEEEDLEEIGYYTWS